jgi:Fic family protein
MTYIHELPDWPAFTWRDEDLSAFLAAVRHQQGRLVGRMEALGFDLRADAVLRTLTQDILKTSEIEGEVLDGDQVRSSIARHLGMDVAGLKPSDRHVDGVVELVLDATQNFDAPLDAQRLFGWHASLFPGGRSGLKRIEAGAWRSGRSGPMQVVSGPVGRERVHFEAPDAGSVDREMARFLNWFEGETAVDLVLKAGIAHLWFVTIHPFDDGNGRIARAIADLALARSEGTRQRFYSMSAQVRQERAAYYEMLERTQKGTMDITPWLAWFLGCLARAFDAADETLHKVLFKARFWNNVGNEPINARQRLILNRLLDGFEGKLTSSKWAKLAKCSQDTALRDITDLVDRGLLVSGPAGGRSSHYFLP